MNNLEAEIQNINQLIGNNIKKARTNRGLSREQLSRKIGVKAQQLYKYEMGINSVSAGRLRIIAKVLGIEEKTFFEQD